MKIDGYFLITYSVSLLQSVSVSCGKSSRERMENEKNKINKCYLLCGCCGSGRYVKATAIVGNSFFNAVSANKIVGLTRTKV